MTDQTDDPACAVAHGHGPSPDDIAHGHGPSPDDIAHGHGPSPDDIAHGYAAAPGTERTLVAVFASPVAEYLLRYAADAGFRPVLVEPDARRAPARQVARAPAWPAAPTGTSTTPATSW